MSPEKKSGSASQPGSVTQKKILAIALQGGGSHGAYTWGVLDALLADERIQVEGFSGTSAGAMNATACAQGIIAGGNEKARETLATYWKKVGELGKNSFLQPFPWNKQNHHYSLSDTPAFHFLQKLTTIFSPYQFNPFNYHPLRSIIEELFDFKLLQEKSHLCKLFLCATHVATGKLKIFKEDELTADAVLASACVPHIFQAVQVNGEFYWDGGFIGNPAIYPLIYGCDTPDILIIQIRRVYDPVIPTTAHEIQNRLGEITQNACLTREMRSIDFISKLIDQGVVPPGKLKRLHIHILRDDAFWGTIDRASGFCADPEFLDYLFKAGHRAGKNWLAENYDSIGVKTTAHIEEDFI
jgi:NTE family protein